MSKYIDADRLRTEIERRLDELNPKTGMLGDRALRAVNPKTFPRESELEKVLYLIDSLQQEQDILVINKKDWEEQEKFLKNKKFGVPLQKEQPNVDLEEEILATHPKVEVPNKYKTPDWLWNKQEQPEVDLVAELKHHLDTTPKEQLEKEWKELEPWCNVGPTVQEFLYGKQPEVDLEKEIQEYIQKLGFGYGGWVDGLSDEDLKNIARYFYGLGLKAK